ncbi:MAG: hypothetical protein Q4F53_08645 [Nesterenkonia sp.]|uniref:hypothetical protein n=1 Tax=Nesterenkonia marinintestina TaxID=2979865 RepID=UPI0021BFD972|nr:hypothetical protein [Nesterenkonia sp. GX14115]MDO5493661.1 hypothetical protein [Nesterenkonia sp.]
MRRAALLGAAFSFGAVLGVIGTALHGSIWMIGDVRDGFVLPWGAALALLICLLAQLWVGLRSGSLVDTAVMGITTFTVATAAYLWPGPDQLVVPYSPEAMEMLPGPTIASLIWWLGSAAVTLITMVLVKWIVARDEALHRADRLTP